MPVYFHGLPVATDMRHLVRQVLEVFSDLTVGADAVLFGGEEKAF